MSDPISDVILNIPKILIQTDGKNIFQTVHEKIDFRIIHRSKKSSSVQELSKYNNNNPTG
ncbi:10547_t:CDS:1, partial [Dentiscutata erythropus]